MNPAAQSVPHPQLCVTMAGPAAVTAAVTAGASMVSSLVPSLTGPENLCPARIPQPRALTFRLGLFLLSVPGLHQDPLISPFRGAQGGRLWQRLQASSQPGARGMRIIHRITDVCDEKSTQKHISLIHPTLQCRLLSKITWPVPICKDLSS